MTKYDPKKIAELLRLNRKAKSFTQREVSLIADIPMRSLQELESGRLKKPSFDRVHSLLEFYKVDPINLEECKDRQ